MAKNFVEHHIQQGGLHTFKVEAGQIVKIGEMVEITANGKVQVAGADSQKVVGVVYSGTVGIDGKNVGYSGDENMVATVVVLKPFVYLEAGATITAGDALKTEAGGKVVKLNTVAGDTALIKIGLALQGANAGERFLALLG
ncbi:hypothetical protein CG478_000960 [Bacillus cytotoxicus]|uniref:hypothetical protein n=1 Tax=Bacillus cytotoxicus TaxID=580165 RepID=UPI000B9610A1|nr:hypothetical protein [Bacillus cytotoxicus]AWC27143.1 hypothetical protein CG483_000960 [Bacillus cytotoxicus]AWC39257.1 hypothetical protein CG480_000960 [Bacillus cytotoxicus]AWC47188.1 hypothetical protein CG478_000960 [Bacillus cytotoxicus]AWC51209.1 hypothetical protein CG477_000960 [Bacillus cytotoxicus]AWC55338.1 hypothetical protein CG476_000960 [Bacillus cytotoxicus]